MLLAMDTTLGACSVALADASTVVARQKSVMERGQAEQLLPMVERLMADAGYAMADISRIAVTSGPGSFTGVRLAVAAARGLALALKCPVAAVTTLELIAGQAVRERSLTEGQHVAALLDARRGQVFGQLFKVCGRGYPIVPCDEAASYQPLYPEPWRSFQPALFGDGCTLFDPSFPNSPLPDAADLAQLALSLGADRWGDHPSPFYICEPSATPSRAPRLVIK